MLQAEEVTLKEKVLIGDFQSGDIFFDIDASWGDSYNCDELFSSLKEQGAIIIKLHFDAVPILTPEFSHAHTVFRFAENFSASLKYSDYWYCISNTVKKDLYSICKSINLGRPTAHKVQLGGDFSTSKHIQANSKISGYGTFLLSVGTVEPRKNHQLLLDGFDACKDDYPELNLVIVGKQGWNVEDVSERILKHPDYGQRVFWLQNASDTDVLGLYGKALASINLSHYEGYGLPVIESLSQNCISICTKGSAMEEVSRGAAVTTALNINAVKNAVLQLRNEKRYAKLKLDAAEFVTPTWDEAADGIYNALRATRTSPGISSLPCQAVYISIRPDALHRSISSIIEYMPYINSVVVLTADNFYNKLSDKLAKLEIQITIIKESEVGLTQLPHDHQVRNTLLRKKLYAEEIINDNFIAFDDDYIVINPSNTDDFIQDGVHQSYYFYTNGADWLGGFPKPTSFDEGLFKTVRFLKSCGYDYKLYNSHSPQIINKSLALQILVRTEGMGLDEWSVYFNIAKHLHPNNFADRPYRVIGWPGNISSWLPTAISDDVIFENYYEHNNYSLPTGTRIDRYLDDYKSAKVYKSHVRPEKAVLTLSNQGLAFNSDKISGPESSRCELVLQVELRTFNLNLRIQNRNYDFNELSSTRWFLLRFSSIKQNKPASLDITLTTDDNVVHFLSIPVSVTSGAIS
ncbi:glycosyltransferase [Sinobacterium norvegicum]|nr:glycosyltransferase [Sinobacterium norvegicum]